MSGIDCLSDEYLTILLRELKSILPKPTRIIDFNVFSKDSVEKLEKLGLKNTDKFFDKVITKTDRKKLADSIGVNYSDILELTKLSDLSRIKWVGVIYAQMLYNLGVDTVEKVSKSDPIDLHARINQMIKEYNIFKGAIGLNDVHILIETANELSIEIEY